MDTSDVHTGSRPGSASHEFSTAALNTIGECAGAAAVSLRPNGEIDCWSSRAERLFDLRAADAVGLPFILLLAEESREAFSEVEERLQRGEQVERHKAAAARVGKDPFPITVSAAPVPRGAGAALLLVRETASVGAPPRVRDLLAEGAAAAPLAVLYLDLEGRIRYANQAAANHLGRTPGELEGAHLVGASAPEQRDRLAFALEESLAGHRQTIELKGSAEGEEVVLRWNLLPRSRPGRGLEGIYLFGTDVSDSKRAEQARSESEKRLHLAMEVGRLGAWRWDVASGRVEWSPTLESIHGRAPGPFGGTFESVLEDLEPADEKTFREAVATALRTGEELSFRYRIRAPDGSLRWLETRGNIERDASGSPRAMFGICMDVTQAIQAEEAMRQRHQTLEAVVALNTSIAAQLELKALVQATTDAAVELTGAAFGAFFYNMIDSRGEAYQLYTLSGADPAAFAQFPMPRATEVFGVTFRGEGVVRLDDVTKDPRYGRNAPYYGMPQGHLPVRSYLAAPVISMDGTVLGGLFLGHPEAGVFTESAELALKALAAQTAVGMDHASLFESNQKEIMARAQAERRLQHQLAFTETITDCVASGLILLDSERRPTFMNAAAERLTGYRLEELEGRDLERALAPEARELADPLLSLDPSNDGPAGREGVLVRKDGELLPVLYNLATIPRDGAEQTSLFEFRDLSELRQAERALRETEQELAERRRAERRLQELNEQLEQRNTELQEFAYVASHDLREPLRKIISFGALASRRLHEGGSADLQDYLDRMNGAARRMDELVVGLLNLSRIQTAERKFRPVDLREALEEVKADLQVAIEETAAVINVRGKLPVVDADPIQMRQLFQNLLANSLRFHAAGRRPQLDIWASLQNGARRNEEAAVVLLFRDNGIGFAPEHAEKIFQPFRRLHGRAQYPGTGIGLSICQRIVLRHGGSIRAEGRPGEGAMFEVVLPLRQDEDSLRQRGFSATSDS